MPIEDHPLYQEWSDALDHLREANERYRAASIRNDRAIETYRLDLLTAKRKYDEVSTKLGDFDAQGS